MKIENLLKEAATAKAQIVTLLDCIQRAEKVIEEQGDIEKTYIYIGSSAFGGQFMMRADHVVTMAQAQIEHWDSILKPIEKKINAIESLLTDDVLN